MLNTLNLWLSIRQPAEEWVDRPTFWFELAPEGWSYGMGYWVSKPVTTSTNRITTIPQLRCRVLAPDIFGARPLD